jgi:hypothetical protein
MMSGFSFVEGTGRALNTGFPFKFSLPWLLPPPVVDGFVTLEGAYPSSSPPAAATCLICSRAADATPPIEPRFSVVSSGGRSVVGKGGEDAKRAAI